MCTVFWDEKTQSFESADGIYTVAEVADAIPASENILKTQDVVFTLSNNQQ
jgi:hypothetical protein